MKEEGRHRFRLKGLGVRLMFLMGAALLPLAILSYVQTLAAARIAESRARDAILGETLLSATPQVEILMRASGTATTLAATLPQVIGDDLACRAFVRRVAAASKTNYTFVGFIPTDGVITCTSTPEAYDMKDSAWMAEWLAGMLAKPETRLTVNREGPISGTSILNISVPVRGPDERLLGFASVSMAHSAIEAQGTGLARSDDRPLALMTFDQTGEILTSTAGMDTVQSMLPTRTPLASFVGVPGQSFLDVTATGQRRAFAVVPISPGSLYLLGSWSAEKLDQGGLSMGLPAPTFPLLMWAASLLVAWLAAESQVLRHVRALRDSITAFSGGDRKVKPLDNANAALELREAGDAYEKMTEAILHDEAHLENTIHQKEVLLREVHHRVKNNLQLIASILNMQLRTARSVEARAAMKSVQERVLSLATIHRELYQTSGLADIRADELLPRIIHHILKIGSAPERHFALDLQIDDVRLVPDQAVPLSLFLTEGLTNVLKHTLRGRQPDARIAVRFTRRPDGTVELLLANTLPSGGSSETDAPEGFGSKLLMAFAHQLDGQMVRHRVDDSYRLTLVFRPSPLSEAEERDRPNVPDASSGAAPDSAA